MCMQGFMDSEGADGGASGQGGRCSMALDNITDTSFVQQGDFEGMMVQAQDRILMCCIVRG